MEWLTSTYPDVKKVLLDWVPEHWPELKEVISRVVEPKLPNEVALVVSSCHAVGGNPGHAVHAAAALTAAEIGVRMLDDLADQDKNDISSEIGASRTYNYAAALNAYALDILYDAPWPMETIIGISRTFIDTFLTVAAGQDRDIMQKANSFEEYWLTVEMKTASAFSTASSIGAMVGTTDPELVKNCFQYGHHLGMCIQIFNDLQSTWKPEGPSDIQLGKLSFPIFYGLEPKHPNHKELQDMVDAKTISQNESRVLAILDGCKTREFLVWRALKERDLALEALDKNPNEVAVKVLRNYITNLFKQTSHYISVPG